jgi:hypothetical protein
MRNIALPAAKLPAARSCAFIQVIVMTTTPAYQSDSLFRHRPAPYRGVVE